MSLATSNRDGGRTSESGHLRSFMKAFKGQVLSGLNVTQRGAGANMSVDVAIGDTMIPRSDLTYGHPAWNDAVYNQAISAADVSNPRRDIIVIYIDYGQAPSTGVSNNTNGVVKIKVVNGTPAGSPADPTDVAIQASVGSGNPFVKLGRVRVAAGASSVTNSVIDDLRLLARFVPQGDWTYDDLYTWTYVSATSFKIAGVDVTSQFPVGTRIAVYQSGAIKYFYVTAAVFSTDTTLTVDGSTLYTLANVPIDKPAFSYADRPAGFPYQSISLPKNWWQELARVTWASGTSMDTGTFIPKKYLQIILVDTELSATGSDFNFNADTGANYARQRSLNGAAYASSTAQTTDEVQGNFKGSQMSISDIINIATLEKVYFTRWFSAPQSGTVNSTAQVPGGGLYQGKWVNVAAQITRVKADHRGVNYAAGSELIVLGHD